MTDTITTTNTITTTDTSTITIPNLNTQTKTKTKTTSLLKVITEFCIISILLAGAGFLLGSLHAHQWILFTVLVIILVVGMRMLFIRFKVGAYYKLIGFFMTACIGTACEFWGTYHHYWTYHLIPSYQLIPVWIPIAWGYTFFVSYLYERCVFKLAANRAQKLFWLLLVSIFFPTVGEYIPVYMNVWTYHWPYQVMGVPLLASAGLSTIHLLVYRILRAIYTARGHKL